MTSAITPRRLIFLNFQIEKRDCPEIIKVYMSPKFQYDGCTYHIEMTFNDRSKNRCWLVFQDKDSDGRFKHAIYIRFPDTIEELQNLYESLSGEKLKKRQIRHTGVKTPVS